MKIFRQKLNLNFDAVPDLLKAAGITFAVMALTVLILGSQFQTNDDQAMNLIISGAYGEISNRLIFSNTILGIVLEWLYTWIPSINWYTWMHLTALYLASTACVYLLLITVPKKLRMMVALGFLGVAIMPATMQIQFTMQAYFCIIAGFALFAYAFLKPEVKECRKKRIIMLVASIALCLLGYMFRDKAIYTVAPFFIILAGYLFYKGNKKPVLWLVLICVVCAGAFAVNARSYSSQKWQDYFRFNTSRALLLDSPRLDYDDNRDVFEAVGWSETDYNVFYSWMLADEDRFTAEKLTYIKDNGRWPPVTPGSLITNYVQSMDSVLKFFPFCFLFLCLSLCLMTREKKNLPILIVASVIFMHFLFIFMQRAPVRTVFPHYILGILLLLLLIDYSKLKLVFTRKEFLKKDIQGLHNIKGTILLALCLGIILLTNTAIAETTYYRTKDNYAYAAQVDNYIKENKDKVFISSVTASGPRYRAYSVFYAPEKGMLENYASLGGWYTKSPRYFAFKTEHAMGNMFLSLLDEDVYLIERGEPMLIQLYLYEDFQIQTQALLIAEFEDVGVYKLYKVV